MILLIKEFLNNKEQSKLLEEINNCSFDNENKPFHWLNSIKRIKFEDKDILHKVTNESKNVLEQFFKVKIKKQHNLHAVVWPQEKSMGLHKDYGANNEFSEREYTTLIYLNNTYEGGELSIPSLNFNVKPSAGTLISFKGGSVEHEVKKILKGIRYTIVCWWEI